MSELIAVTSGQADVLQAAGRRSGEQPADPPDERSRLRSCCAGQGC